LYLCSGIYEKSSAVSVLASIMVGETSRSPLPTTELSSRHLAALQQATQMLLSGRQQETVLETLLLLLRSHTEVQRAAVYLLEPSGHQLSCRAEHQWPAERPRTIPLPDSDPVAVAARVHSQQVTSGNDASAVYLPLLIRERALGTLVAEKIGSQGFTNEDLVLLSLLAAQVAVLLENHHLREAEHARTRQVELLHLIVRSAATAPNPGEFCALLADLLGDAFENANVAVLLCPPEKDLRIAAHAGNDEPQMERLLQARQLGPLGQALRQKRFVLAEDASTSANPSFCYGTSGSEVCIPLVSGAIGLGAVVIARRGTHAFNKEELALAQVAAEVAANTVRSLHLSEELDRSTSSDPLTGTSNQRHFHAMVEQECSRARRYKKTFGLITLDLRHFREVNAALGVQGADQVLKQVAASLRARLRNHDTLSRYDGDQFAIVLPEVDSDGVGIVLTKLHAAVETIQAGATRRLTGAWASVTFPEDGNSEADLLNTLFGRLDTARRSSISSQSQMKSAE
jgi:diguanylate cyclase (GGDEF)-like protein